MTFRDMSGEVFPDFGSYVTVQRTPKDISSSGDTELVPAQGLGKSIRVLALFYEAALAVSVRFKTAGNNLSATYTLAINGQLTLPYCPHGWFQTGANEAFNVNQGAAIASGAQVIWIVV
jgi:hypothetical protein